MAKIDFKKNFYRFKRIKDKYLLTTDAGIITLLDETDFNLLKSDKITPSLLRKLRESGIIITKDSQEKTINRTREHYNFLMRGASLHIVVPTLCCNMKCIYCQASSVSPDLKKYNMTEKTAKKTVDFIMQTPANSICIEFQGGEPLLNFPIVKFIIDYANECNKNHNKKISFTLVSNLSCMDDEKLDYFIKNNVGICTSLDGPKFIHDFNRPAIAKTSGYDFVSLWIKKIHETYNKRNIDKNVNALITVTKKTLDYPKAIVDEYINQRINQLHLRPLTSLGCASSSWQITGYTPESFIDFWKKSMDYIIELNKKGINIRERMATIMISKFNNVISEDFLDLRSPCGAAIGQLLYNYDGSIFTCDEGRMVGNDIFKVGNVSQKYKDVLTSKQVCSIVSASINDGFICDYCVYKPYCGVCPVCNYFEQGSIIAKIPETPRCKIFMAMFDYLAEKYFFDDSAKSILDKWVFGKEKEKGLNTKKRD